MKDAARGGHESIVQSMLDKGANEFDDAIANAARGGYNNIIQLIAAKKSSTTSHGNYDFNGTMIEGARGGHEDIVQSMLELGADDFNKTMIKAARGGHKKIVDLMIEKGATDFNGGMLQAIRGDHRSIVDLMIEKGATVFNDGMLMATFKNRYEMVELMIEKGATNLHKSLILSIEHDHERITRLILGQDLIFSLHKVICKASEYGRVSIVKLILDTITQNGKNPENLLEYDFDEPLTLAAKGGHNSIVRLLIKIGASDFNSALACANACKHRDTVWILFKEGATDISCLNWMKILDKEFSDLLDFQVKIIKAIEENDEKQFQFLIRQRKIIYPNGPMIMAARCSRYNLFKLIVARRSLATAESELRSDSMLDYGATSFNKALEEAVNVCCEPIVRLILDTQKVTNVDRILLDLTDDPENERYTNVNIVRMLFNYGTSVSPNRIMYNTAISQHTETDMWMINLMITLGANNFNEVMKDSARYNKKAVVRSMLEKGADNFDEAMLEAIQDGAKKIVQWMLQRGAKRVNDGLIMACQHYQVDIVELMLQHGADNLDEVIENASSQCNDEIVKIIKKWKDNR